MPRMSKKRRLEWSFFLRQVKVGNSTCDRITYNDLCRGCPVPYPQIPKDFLTGL